MTPTQAHEYNEDEELSGISSLDDVAAGVDGLADPAGVDLAIVLTASYSS